MHACGAVFDNPDLLACCVVGDGEAETGPLATSWHGNKFLNPARDGAVLPILHLNGYKIANPPCWRAWTTRNSFNLFTGYGWKPYFVEGHEPEAMHQLMAGTLDTIIPEIKQIQDSARGGEWRRVKLPTWPMIILRSPKGMDWTESGRRKADRRHMASASGSGGRFAIEAGSPEDSRRLDEELQGPKNYLTKRANLFAELAELAPQGERRMGANPHANGGLLLRDLLMPDFRKYAVDVPSPEPGMPKLRAFSADFYATS
jgi:xylulose-5-phosphate/fructose-6-phosphate phosphoketolase